MTIRDDELLDLLKPDMDKSRVYQSELSTEREKYYRWYRAEPYGNERPGWSQTVHPTIFSVVEWMKPGLIEVFTGDFFTFNPIVKSKTTGAEDHDQSRQQADRLKRYVRHKLFSQLEGEQLIEDFVHDCLVGHYGVMKVTQREDFDLTTELLPEMTTEELEALAARDETVVDIRGGKAFSKPDPFTGQERTGLTGAKAIRRKPRYTGFNLEVLPASELYMLPGYPDLQKNPFVAHVVRRDLDYIRRQELAGVYRKGTFDKVARRVDERRAQVEVSGEYHTMHAVDGLSTPDSYGTGGEGQNSRRLAQGEVWVWECYTRLALDETKLLKPCIVTLCEDIILRGPLENPYGGPPFELGFVYKEPHKSIGRPVAAVLDHRQRVLSNLLRNIQDSAAMGTYRGWLTTDARSKRVLAAMGPGDVSLVPALGTTQELVPAPADPFIINAFQLTLQEVSKESGINENMQGLDNNALNTTATGMQMRLSAGMQRQKLYARRLARTFKRILARILDIIRLYPPQDGQNILGSDVMLAPEDFQGEYTVSIDVGVGPQDRQANAKIMDELVQIMLKAGLQLGICEPKSLIKALKAKYEYMDIDVDEYLLPEEKFDQMAQLKQQIEELQGHNQGLQQAIAEHAKELRSGKGPNMGPGGPGSMGGPGGSGGPNGPGGRSKHGMPPSGPGSTGGNGGPGMPGGMTGPGGPGMSRGVNGPGMPPGGAGGQGGPGMPLGGPR